MAYDGTFSFGVVETLSLQSQYIPKSHRHTGSDRRGLKIAQCHLNLDFLTLFDHSISQLESLTQAHLPQELQFLLIPLR